MEQRQALAALALSGALFALALPRPFADPIPCPHPVESQAVDGHTIAVRCAAPEQRAGAIRGPARRLFELPIELNCAGARTLETLDGIGAVRARSIVEERERRPFERVDDLLRVHGIGPKTLEGLRAAVAASPRAVATDSHAVPADPHAVAADPPVKRSGSVDSAGCRLESASFVEARREVGASREIGASREVGASRRTRTGPALGAAPGERV